MQRPWSGCPGYASVQVQDLNRAEEQSFVIAESYLTISPVTQSGKEVLHLYALFVHGWGRVDPSTKAGVADENESDADMSWRPNWGSRRGF